MEERDTARNDLKEQRRLLKASRDSLQIIYDDAKNKLDEATEVIEALNK